MTENKEINIRTVKAREFRVSAYRAELALLRTRNAAYVNHLLTKREEKLLKLISQNMP